MITSPLLFRCSGARMKPLLHPSSCFIIFFLSVSLLILSINIPICLCEDHSQYTDCNTAFSCEGISISDDLKYPFWGGNRDKHCAGVPDPNLELKCEGNVSIITINQVKYRVLDWNNTTQRLKVARDDYGGGNICEVSDYKNSTFENSPFQRDGEVSNVTLLYNCDANPTTMLYRMTCGGGTTAIVYTVVDHSSVYCSPTVIVVIPLLGQQAASLVTGSGINDALKEGFELKWTGDYRKCQTCVDSGGVCGNAGENGFTCFCKDAPYTTICNSEKASSSSPKRNRLLIVIGALVGGSGVMIFFIIMISCYLKRGRGGELLGNKENLLTTM